MAVGFHKRVVSYTLSAMGTGDSCVVAFHFADGTSHKTAPLPPARLAALAAVLRASPAVTFHVTSGRGWYIVADHATPGE